MRELPQVRASVFLSQRQSVDRRTKIVFTLRAVQYPASIPISIASLTLINHTANTFSSSLFSLFGESFSLAEQFASVRKLYEISNIRNRIVDGKVSFPENQQDLRHGISIEFRHVWVYRIHNLTSRAPRNVSFRYPGSENYALNDVSFKIGAGQLCVRSSLHEDVFKFAERSSTHTGHRRREWFWEEYDFETDITHI